MDQHFDTNANVTVYTKADCPQCVATKNLLKQLAVPFNEINIDTNSDVREFLVSQNFRAAPVVMTDTDSWAGFNEGKLRALAPAADENVDWDF